MKKPNILFVMSDQQRASALGCAGEPVQTPHLDRLAAQGTRFTRAVSNTPCCSPARASLMTGLHALTHGLVNNDKPLGTRFRCLAHALNEIGYRCGYIGKWHLDEADRSVFIPPGPRRLGFDDYWAVANCNHNYLEAYYYENDDPSPRWIDGYEPEHQTELALQYLESRARQNDPFCLFLSWGPPHCPYRDVPQKYLDLYPPESIELRPNTPPHTDREIVAGYYAHISALDACFGRLMEALERLGLAENTIVVFTSDHGDMLFSQDRGWKSKPWWESAGIPLLMRWPGHIPAGREARAPVGIVDLAPTLLGLVDGRPSPDTQGLDLSSYVLGDRSASPESQYLCYPVCPKIFSFDEWRAVITRNHTYARTRQGPWLLYDDLADPWQLNNLTEKPEAAGLLRDMESLLQGWLEKLGDAFEDSDTVAERLYPGHVDGVLPFYENDEIRSEKERRRKARLEPESRPADATPH